MAKKVLLIEDSKIEARILHFKLTQAGFEVFALETGGDAVATIREQKPDALILDLGLPMDDAFSFHWDGFKILGWLNQQPRPRPPVIVTTGQPESFREKLLKMGAADFFTKPVDLERLVSSLETAIQKAESEAKYAVLDNQTTSPIPLRPQL